LPKVDISSQAVGCASIAPDGSNTGDVWSYFWGQDPIPEAARVGEVDMADFVLGSCDAYLNALVQSQNDTGWEWDMSGRPHGFTGYLQLSELGTGLGQFCYGNVCMMAILPSDSTSLDEGMASQFPGQTADDFMNDLMATMDAVAAGG